jgi:putative pyruvate formate lyase activating enzyme
MEIAKFLNHYFKVESNSFPAGFRIAQKVPVEFDSESSIDDLWAIHSKAMDNYWQLYNKKLQEIQNFTDCPPVHPSLMDLKAEIADRIIEKCTCCGWRCRVNRKNKELGYCRIGSVSRCASEFLHRGEEPEIVPSHTIFFTGCVFSCVYCQNWDISTRPDNGIEINPFHLAKIIDARRRKGSKNVNFVTPTPHLHNVLKTINNISENLPIIWNSNMYHSEEASELLEGIIDVFLADFRYGNDRCAKKYSDINNYTEIVKRNFKKVYQHSDIIIRHLVLPKHLECCTKPVIEWTVENIPHVRFNLMFQYTPFYKSCEYPEINRKLGLDEQEKSIEIAKNYGIEDLLV